MARLPSLIVARAAKSWVAGTRLAMTKRKFHAHEEPVRDPKGKFRAYGSPIMTQRKVSHLWGVQAWHNEHDQRPD
jgi:hypothetical protein